MAAATEFDALIVGGGHNGLCTAAYLARSGWSVAILEKRHEEGGGANTEEPCIPGFYHNMHAQFMEFYDYMPFYQDFSLEKLGAQSVYPEAQCGIAFADGRPPIIIHRPDLLDRTHKSISRYSKKDADTFCELKRRTMDIDQLLAAQVYNPPPMVEPGELPEPLSNPFFREVYKNIFDYLGLDLSVALKSPKVMIDELFETPELKTLLYRECVEWGTPLDMEGGAISFVAAVLWLNSIWRLAIGGTHTLAHAMVQACLREGVTFLESADVCNIVVEGNRVTGVQTVDGREFKARQVVASSVDVKQTFLDLVGEENLSEAYVTKSRNFRYGPSHVLGTTAWCIKEPPHYLSAKEDPEIDRCFYTVVGFETPDEILDYVRAAYGGHLPEIPGAGIWVNSIFDPSQAPSGQHSMTGWFFFPSADELTDEEWTEVRDTYNGRFLDLWSKYAPNMTEENVIDQTLYTPDQMDEKNRMRLGDFSNGAFALDQLSCARPFPEASQYRTEIDGLYLCGASSHPGGGMHAGCGYNAFKAIAEDYEIKRPPIPEGRLY